ncbi:MAG: 2,3-bisphosphoglycerate-independent phosphoglycerate mutase [Kiritimatiellae bacterium]|nr:2,3-bisphosphoglycerate-independent phosphoglycerate mutase [Kiritimatiellia bacterium]
MRPVVLIIRDGWGINPREKGNAVFAAQTPTIDRIRARYPYTRVQTSGEAVGLPAGYMGSSEVGHLNMGAGRIVEQELKRIDDGLSNGTLFTSPKWANLIKNWKKNKSTLHFMGLLQDEGVHAHQEHLFKLMRRARQENPEGKIVIHPFLDGRDTPPRSTASYLVRLQKEMEAVGNCVIGTMMGRYYGMDRSKNWDITDQAFHVLTMAKADRRTNDVLAAVQESYANDKTPDGTEMTDEYIPPYIVGDFAGIQDGDSVMHFNYRQDRAIQLTQAFVCDDYAGKRLARPKIAYLGFTRYWDEFEDYLLGAMGGDGGMDNLLGEVVSRAGIKQLRIAETQKFRHVTSFFNGKSTKPSEGEEQVDIKSRFDPATFASHPEMEAYNVTDALLKKLENNPYGLIVVNYANCDMVGHTGDYDAAKRAVEIVDECIGKLLPRLMELDAHVLITADHGNAEEMFDYDTKMVKTSHTTFDVELFYVAKDAPGTPMLEFGKLADIAPTILYLLGIPQPKEMTAVNLITGKRPWND